MQDVLEAAIQLHQSGQLGQAAQLYQKVLAKEHENASALHLLGVLHHQQGDHAKAVDLIGRAVALRPSVPAFHANLAEAYRALGQLDRSVGCCRAALRLWPEYPEALCNLGVSLQGLGKKEEASLVLRKALELRPDFVMAMNNLAITLRELGQHDEAITHFRRAVEIDPNFAAARTNLGQMLVDRGLAAEALPHCQEAVRLQPDLAALHHNLGNVYRALDRLVEARSEYLEALRIEPNLAQAAAHLGLVLKNEGKFADALPWIKQAVELDPENSTYWESLADLHSEREEPAEAITCWERVLVLETEERASTHLSLGWSFQEEGRLAEAGEHYRKAIKIQPESSQAQLNLGGLFEELGEMEQAETAFRKALEMLPSHALPHARLATLLRGKLPHADLSALEQRLADEKLPPEPRSHLLFGLAHVLDAKGDHRPAAECLAKANALRIELDGDRRKYQPEDHEKFIDGMMRTFDQSFIDRLSGQGIDSRRPVFVFGLPRSGTTLVEQVLSSHPNVHGAGELRLARSSFESIATVLDRTDPPLDCVPHLDTLSVRRIGEKHLEKLAAIDQEKHERIVDKMPDNYMYLGLLSILFPNAAFIHCKRDLRDIAVSCWMTDFRSIRWSNQNAHIASRFQQYRKLTDHWNKTVRVPIVEVAYEDTVADLEGVARRLIAACGLEWDRACLGFHQNQRPVRTASITQVRQPIYTRSVARWRNYEPELASLFALLASEGKLPEITSPLGN